MSKYPQCECKEKRFEYLRKRYKNGTLHMFRKCEACGKVAQNAMTQSNYDANWVDTLPISETGGRSEPVHSVKPPLKSRADAVKSRAPPVQRRAEAIQAKLRRHIESREGDTTSDP